MDAVERLKQPVLILRIIHYTELVLLIFCILAFVHFMYGKFAVLGFLPGRELAWNRTYAVCFGVVVGLSYSCIHVYHLLVYPGYLRHFIEMTTTIDRYYAEQGFAPVPDNIKELSNDYRGYLEPYLYNGKFGIKMSIAMGMFVVFASLLFRWFG